MQAFLQAASMMSREDEGGMIAQLTRVECGGSHTYYWKRGDVLTGYSTSFCMQKYHCS